MDKLIKKWKLWRTNRRIAYLERREAEARASLIHLQTKILPKWREKRNQMMFGGTQ